MAGLQHAAQSDWFGQPRGLTILFLTEMWEKFSFFGMRALLVYYMIGRLEITQANASLIYGLYTAAVFLTPLMGALIADRWIGRRRAVVSGGVIMAIGHFMMASEPLFYAALATIAMGSGLLLPNLPSQIQGLYDAADPRRASAYSIYYIGINLGGLIAPLICGTVGEFYGWHWGFGIAGLGMIIGLATYLWGSRYLPVEPLPAKESVRDRASYAGAKTAMADRYKLLLTISAIVMLLRASYEQIGNTVAVLIETGVSRSVTSEISIPMTWFQSLNPLLVFLMTPLLIALWHKSASIGRGASPLKKMALGSLLICSAYVLMTGLSVWAAANDTRLAWPWIVLFFVIMTAGELHIFPVGLDLFARLAPVGFTATAIAIWYLAGFAGNLLAGGVGSFWGSLSHAEFFGLMAAIAAGSAMLFLLFDGSVERTPGLSNPAEPAIS